MVGDAAGDVLQLAARRKKFVIWSSSEIFLLQPGLTRAVNATIDRLKTFQVSLESDAAWQGPSLRMLTAFE